MPESIVMQPRLGIVILPLKPRRLHFFEGTLFYEDVMRAGTVWARWQVPPVDMQE